jgi:lipoate-protein ligase B
VLVLNLGREPYQRIWELQHSLVKARQEGHLQDVLILLEHEPTITLGRNADARHILASEATLVRSGIVVHRVERGGDVTYHGPGQLVGYPIVSLYDHHLSVSDYMHSLEDVIVSTLDDFGLRAERRKGLIGVWIGPRKVAALGARVEHGISYHGFAINVAPDLNHFELIVPCGLTDVRITSMQFELGTEVDPVLVRQRVVFHFGRVFCLSTHETSLARLLGMCDASGDPRPVPFA